MSLQRLPFLLLFKLFTWSAVVRRVKWACSSNIAKGWGLLVTKSGDVVSKNPPVSSWHVLGVWKSSDSENQSAYSHFKKIRMGWERTKWVILSFVGTGQPPLSTCVKLMKKRTEQLSKYSTSKLPLHLLKQFILILITYNFCPVRKVVHYIV